MRYVVMMMVLALALCGCGQSTGSSFDDAWALWAKNYEANVKGSVKDYVMMLAVKGFTDDHPGHEDVERGAKHIEQRTTWLVSRAEEAVDGKRQIGDVPDTAPSCWSTPNLAREFWQEAVADVRAGREELKQMQEGKARCAARWSEWASAYGELAARLTREQDAKKEEKLSEFLAPRFYSALWKDRKGSFFDRHSTK